MLGEEVEQCSVGLWGVYKPGGREERSRGGAGRVRPRVVQDLELGRERKLRGGGQRSRGNWDKRGRG